MPIIQIIVTVYKAPENIYNLWPLPAREIHLHSLTVDLYKINKNKNQK